MKNYLLFKAWASHRLPYLTTLLLLFWVTINSAQNIPISGTVTDGQGALTGVNVTIKNKTVGTFTNAQGKFQINADAKDTLVFSSIGYKGQEQLVGTQISFNITLQPDETTLQEVLINAGYYKVKDKERTGSIAKITAKDIENQPVSNLLSAMQGRMSGVNITQSTGLPGGGFSIQIRGLNAIRGTGNDPLYIVNGVPFASQAMGNASLNNGVLSKQANPLNSINPADIESIEVLKDADATAIYGSRGANGVVLITTKKGKTGKAQVEVQAATTVSKVTNYMKLLNTKQYLKMREEAFENDGITEFPLSDYDVNGTWSRESNTDWQKKLIGKDAIINTVQIGLSGGSQETQYLLSGTWRNETTVLPGDAHFKRLAVHASTTHQSQDNKFNLRFSVEYANDKNTLPGADLTSFAYTLAPNAPNLYNPDGSLNWQEGTFENPLSYLEGTYLTTTQNLITNAYIAYKLGKGFEIKSGLGYTDTRLSENRARPSTMYNPIYQVTSARSELMINNSSRRAWILEPQISWEGKWNKIKLKVLTGATLQNLTQQALAVDGYGFATNSVMNNLLAASRIYVMDHSNSNYRYSAAFGRINFDWDGKYIVNLTARRDGSSRFGSNKRFANFGAAGIAWIFSKEKALENVKMLSFGKIRSSYGTTGNDQIGDYQFVDTYSVTPNQYDGSTGMAPSRLFNPNFGWETNKKFEIALELGLFNDKVFLTTAYFRNVSGNQLVGIPLPATTGFTSIQANLNATVENKGLEIDLRTVNVKSQNWSWITTLNLSKLKNKLLAFPGLEGSTYRNKLVIGESLNIRKAYHLTGLDPQTGLYTFEDYNNDGKITANEDKKIIIDQTPEYFGGLGNTITYKNWTLDFLFQFVKQTGEDIQASFPAPGLFSNQPTAVLNSFPQNNATIQPYTIGENGDVLDAFDTYTSSDAMRTDASFIRLKSLSLSYTVPSILKGISTNLYIQGQNLLTLTKYNGPDPENQSGMYLPPLRQYTLGIRCSF